MTEPDGVRRSLAGRMVERMPPRVTETMTVDLLTSADNGHVVGAGGLHVGWSWGSDELRGDHLDVLLEHRLSGIHACRYWPDGSVDQLPTPSEFRPASSDPGEDARLEAEHVQQNRLAYADLRSRGLLPPVGQNAGSQDINEHLRTGLMAD